MSVPGPTLRELKARAQKIKPVIHVGHDGVTPALLAALDQALADHGLVKVRFTDHKSERKQLAATLAIQTGARTVLQVGHTVTLYKAPRPEPGASPLPASSRTS